jgi:hypothetical protein
MFFMPRIGSSKRAACVTTERKSASRSDSTLLLVLSKRIPRLTDDDRIYKIHPVFCPAGSLLFL